MTDPQPRRRFLLPEGYELDLRDSLPRAVGYMLLSAASFAVMGAMVKAAGAVPVHEKVFFRNLVTLGITSAFGRGGYDYSEGEDQQDAGELGQHGVPSSSGPPARPCRASRSRPKI